MNNCNVELFGRDPKIQKAIAVARNIAVTKAPVLVVGEAGTGKKTLAQFIHHNSSRTDKVLKFVDCSEDAQKVENIILGHRDEESGRFNKGILEVANGGTVVFANVDGLEEGFQKRLHQILLEIDDYGIDVRIISTTSNNLSKLVGSGRFYRGLYTYISGNQISLNPLRERPEDLIDIAHMILNQVNAKTNRTVKFNADALNKISGHYFSQNISELKNIIESSVDRLETDLLSEEDLALGEKRGLSLDADGDGEGIQLMSLREVEKLLIKKALVHTSENRTQAAKILGVSIRTLRNKINEYRTEGNAYFVNLR